MPDLVEAFRRSPASSGFVLDFDGTLSGIVESTPDALAVPGAAEILERLGKIYGLVGVVSGRRAEDVAGRLAAKGVRYLGVYGAEELSGGMVVQPPEAERWRTMASRLARDASAFLLGAGLAGCEVEYKDLAVSVHFRSASGADAGEPIWAWAETAAQRRGFRASMGRKVVELRPAEVSKAFALERLAGQVSRLLVAGDDSSDVEMFARSKQLLGDDAYCVGIASAEAPEGLDEAADLVLASPEELLTFLMRFA